MRHLMREPFRLVSVTVTGADEDTGDDLVTETETASGTCYFEQLSASESNTDRIQSAQEALAVFDPGTVIDQASKVLVRGAVWSVAGPPDRVHRLGVEHHVEARLRLVD